MITADAGGRSASATVAATLTEVPRQSFGADSQARVISAQCVPRGETPDDIVGLALFLASPAASFLTGQSIAVNGGLTLG